MIQGQLEQDVHADIYYWAYGYYRTISPEDLTTREMCDDYWLAYIESCEMITPETGLEMPHEELDINSAVYTGRKHSYSF